MENKTKSLAVRGAYGKASYSKGTEVSYFTSSKSASVILSPEACEEEADCPAAASAVPALAWWYISSLAAWKADCTSAVAASIPSIFCAE